MTSEEINPAFSELCKEAESSLGMTEAAFLRWLAAHEKSGSVVKTALGQWRLAEQL